jgi:hypothetical protein
VKRSRQVEGDDRVPFRHRKFVDWRHELDAGIVYQDVDAAEHLDCVAHHRLDGVLLREIGAVVAHVDAVIGRELRAELLDLGGVAEPVQHDVGAAAGERRCDAEPDPLVEPVTSAVLPLNIRDSLQR